MVFVKTTTTTTATINIIIVTMMIYHFSTLDGIAEVAAKRTVNLIKTGKK